MQSKSVLERVELVAAEEMIFAGDGVRLAGQVDYPAPLTRRSNFPLMFILHHAGSDDRSGYAHFAQAGLAAGYAVFRWDKRGTGKSGAGGRGSTVQDAVNAYEIALDQPGIDHKHVVILAQDAGAGMLGSAFGLFARVQMPYGVVLATNTLDEDTIVAIESRVLVVMGQNDWNAWQRFGKSSCDAHNRAYKHGAQYYVAPNADRMLIDPRTGSFHFGADQTLQDWLKTV